MVLASLTRRDGGTPGPGTEVRRAGGLGDWNNLRKQLLRMLFFFYTQPGTGSPQAQKGSIKWLLTRTSIHRVVLLSTLGFYTHTHTHTHTHNLFLRSNGLTGTPRTLVWPHPEPHALKPREQRSRLRAPGDFPTSSTLPLHLPVGMSSGRVHHSRSSTTLRQRGALTLSTRPCLPAPRPWGSGFLLPQAPPGP